MHGNKLRSPLRNLVKDVSVVTSRPRSTSDTDTHRVGGPAVHTGTGDIPSSPHKSSAIAEAAAFSLHAKAGTGLGLPICKKV